MMGIVPVPKFISDIIYLPGDDIRYIRMEKVIMEYLSIIFEQYEVTEENYLCVTRNADITPDDDAFDVNEDFRYHMRQTLHKRRKMAAVRLEVANTLSDEMEQYLCEKLHLAPVQIFKTKVPMKLDYILFDACLMGGIEVAYEFVGKCDYMAFSQAEVLAQGFNYKTITTHLLNNKYTSSPEDVCKDYIDYYNSLSGVYRYATVSLVDCNKLEPLANLCSILFSKYRNGLDSLSPSKVQRFYTGNHPWFYDLQSILTTAGASETEVAELQSILDDCVLYKGHTPAFLSDFSIKTFSGFSMYLPRNGSAELNKYYKTLRWNQATGLVE
jgi:hypothetical protein